MEEKRKRKKHYFLKFIATVLAFGGIILYSASFPVTMELLDKKATDFLSFCGYQKEFSGFSEISDFSDKILSKAEYWIEIALENINGTNVETEKVPVIIISCAAKFPSESSNITSFFGKREDPISKKDDFHSGIDIAAEKGSKITAAWPGRIAETGSDIIYGKYIIIEHSKDFFTKYCHLSKIEANKNDFVSANEKIGEAGSTGRSTGNHLHFEVIVEGRKIDPMECFEV